MVQYNDGRRRQADAASAGPAAAASPATSMAAASAASSAVGLLLCTIAQLEQLAQELLVAAALRDIEAVCLLLIHGELGHLNSLGEEKRESNMLST